MEGFTDTRAFALALVVILLLGFLVWSLLHEP